MPQRVTGLLMGICGLLMVAALVLAGLDLRRAASTGPHWKRRLLAAGILLLALIGVPACEKEPPPEGGALGTTTTGTLPKAGDLSQSPRWQRLSATWREASEVASGARGAYPFNEAGKKRMLDGLTTVAADLDSLQQSELLTAAEAGLLRKDLVVLVQDVQAKRPTEMRMATCYIPLPFVPPARESMRSLADRLPLLEQAAQSARLHQEAVSKVLVTIDKHLAVLDKENLLAELDEAERAEAEALREQVKGHLVRIRARIGVSQ